MFNDVLIEKRDAGTRQTHRWIEVRLGSTPVSPEHTVAAVERHGKDLRLRRTEKSLDRGLRRKYGLMLVDLG